METFLQENALENIVYCVQASTVVDIAWSADRNIGALQRRHNGRDGVSNHQAHHSLLNRLFKENIKDPRHWPLCGEFTGDRWIPRTNGQ